MSDHWKIDHKVDFTLRRVREEGGLREGGEHLLDIPEDESESVPAGESVDKAPTLPEKS